VVEKLASASSEACFKLVVLRLKANTLLCTVKLYLVLYVDVIGIVLLALLLNKGKGP